MALDLIDAVIAHLEANTSLTTAFGDTWNSAIQTGVAKFFGDIVDQVALPYCQILEMGETYDYMTMAPGGSFSFTSPGQLMFSVTAADRYQTRELGFLIGKALNDAPLMWPGETLMLIRMSKSQFATNINTGPAVPVIFNRVFIFDYEYSGVL